MRFHDTVMKQTGGHSTLPFRTAKKRKTLHRSSSEPGTIPEDHEEDIKLC
jgi:hypothetical protein